MSHPQPDTSFDTYTYTTSNGKWQLPNDTHAQLDAQPMTPQELEVLLAYQEAMGATLCFDTAQGNPFEAEVEAWADETEAQL